MATSLYHCTSSCTSQARIRLLSPHLQRCLRCTEGLSTGPSAPVADGDGSDGHTALSSAQPNGEVVGDARGGGGTLVLNGYRPANGGA